MPTSRSTVLVCGQPGMRVVLAQKWHLAWTTLSAATAVHNDRPRPADVAGAKCLSGNSAASENDFVDEEIQPPRCPTRSRTPHGAHARRPHVLSPDACERSYMHGPIPMKVESCRAEMVRVCLSPAQILRQGSMQAIIVGLRTFGRRTHEDEWDEVRTTRLCCTSSVSSQADLRIARRLQQWRCSCGPFVREERGGRRSNAPRTRGGGSTRGCVF